MKSPNEIALRLEVLRTVLREVEMLPFPSIREEAELQGEISALEWVESKKADPK